MENNNILQNLFLKQFNESNAIAYNKAFVAGDSDYNFQLLDNAYRLAGKYYAKLKIAIESNKCESEHCALELQQFLLQPLAHQYHLHNTINLLLLSQPVAHRFLSVLLEQLEYKRTLFCLS